MSLSSIKAMKSEKGFTIVELLIVIVVIGILAAIVIVAFNGVQQRANTTSASAAAETVAKKAETVNSLGNSYPTAVATTVGFATPGGGSDASLQGSGVTFVASFTSGTAPSSPSSVRYRPCSSGGSGARITYYDYSTGAETTSVRNIGSGATCTLAANGLTGGPY